MEVGVATVALRPMRMVAVKAAKMKMTLARLVDSVSFAKKTLIPNPILIPTLTQVARPVRGKKKILLVVIGSRTNLITSTSSRMVQRLHPAAELATGESREPHLTRMEMEMVMLMVK